ncbi:MAG: hypothetical protein ABEK75_12420 [Salinibacter sp.]
MLSISNDRFSTFLTRLLSVFGIGLLGVGLMACGGSKDVSKMENVPQWYLTPPEDPNHVFAAQSATSQKMQVALDKATTGARGQLASNLETKVESMTKSFTEEVNDKMRQQFVETQKTITSRVLRGTSAAKKKIIRKENGTYRAFVLMDMPIGKAAQELMSKVKQNKEMYTRFRSSQAFKEMKKAVEEYEKEQKQGMRSQSQGSQGGGGQNQ